MLTLAHPALLWTIPVAVVAVLAASRSSTRALSAARRVASTAVRTLMVVLLSAVLARPASTLPAERPSLTVFLADVSGSVPREAWDSGERRLREAWAREAARGNRCALVAFAGRAEVLVPPTSAPLDGDLSLLAHRAALERLKASDAAGFAALRGRLARLGADETRLDRALDAARSLFEEGATNRIVLLTDARGPQGAGGGAPSLVVPLDVSPRPDAAVARVDAPVAVRAGEPFDVRVALESPAPAEVALAVAVDDEVLPEASRRVRIPAGRSIVLLENLQQKRALAPGVHRLRVTAGLPGDEEPRNNLGTAAFTVTDKPRALLVEGSPGEAEPLARMLAAQDIDFARAASVPASLDEFVAVVLAGVPRQGLSAEAMATLATYVERLGGGLWVVGSPALAGPAGHAGAPLERLLPVRFLETPAAPTSSKPPPAPPAPSPPSPPPADTSGTPKRVLAPSVAMLFLIDKSGSMAGDPIELVKEACIAAAEALSRKDSVAVVAFDGRPRPVLEFTEADRKDYIRDRVRRLFADGPTHIYPALLEAHRAFKADPRAARAAAKHVILLSDGDSLPGDFESAVRKMAEDGITVSTVCVEGPKFEPSLMSQIAEWGKGRFIFAPSFKKVPQIFVQEAKKVLEGLPKDEKPPPALPPDPPPAPPPPSPDPKPEPAQPQPVAIKDPHEVLQGLAGKPLPPLEGKLGSAARAEPGVVVPLVSADGRPVLALRRAGLGRTAVWTSDFAGPWSASWRAWPETGKLVAQLVRFLSSSPPDTELAGRVRLAVSGTDATLRIDPGAPAERIAAVDAETGETLPAGSAADGGGREIRFPLDPGGGVRRILLQRPDGRGLLVGAVRGTDPEYLPSPEGPALLSGAARVVPWPELEKSLAAARMSADRRVDLSPWLVLAVLLLLPLDVALRRYSA